MRGRSAVVLALLLIAVLALAGCSTGGGSAVASSGSSGKNALVGEWVGRGGGTIVFTEDVFKTDPDGSADSAGYRYVIIDDTSMTLTRIAEKNGVEFDDTANSRTEHYNLDGDTLKLESYGDGYFRVGSPEADKAIKEAPELVACRKARGLLEQGIAFENGNNQVTPIDDALIAKVLATGFLTTKNPNDLKCPQGGTYTWEGEGSGNLTCSIHGK